jgi:hypothetical protein
MGSLSTLCDALRRTRHDVCLDAAALMEAQGAPRFDLHLRQAGLGPHDADVIATALRNMDDTPSLRSFSVSYNTNLGDDGAIGLIRALPRSVTAIGMVGCGLGDDSGAALCDWAENAESLAMVCVEENGFSREMRGRLSGLGNLRSRPSVFA